MKTHSVWPLILWLALSLWTWGPQAAPKTHDRRAPDIARVESIAYAPSIGTGILQARVNGQVHSLCNYARVEIDQVAYSTTAKHCMYGIGDYAYDIVTIENFTNFYKRHWLSEITYHALTAIPWVRGISPYSPLDIIGKELTTVGCFPDSGTKKMYCYRITGKPYVTENGMAVLQITQSDQDRILRHDSSGKRIVVSGMSWSPVFDDQWRFFWVLSMNQVQGTSRDGINRIFIEPIRKPSGNLATKLLKN